MSHEIRKDFPILEEGLVYLDSAATTQRPTQVLEEIETFYKNHNANPHRGIYELSVAATRCYEEARETVARFIGAKSQEIIFTKNATESLNLLSYSYGMENVEAGDKIVLSIMEHHSNLVPWQRVVKAKNGVLEYLYTNESYELTTEEINHKITAGTKIVAITQVSNVLGVETPIQEIIARAHEVGAVVVLDGSQSIPHMSVNVLDLDVDFMVFSGHKMMAPFGIGVLYGKADLLDHMEPFLLGGDMIETVTEQDTTYAPVPEKFEAGTQNINGAIGLAAAIRYLQHFGMDRVMEIEHELLCYAKERLSKLPYVELYGPSDNDRQIGVISFNVTGVHAHDVASVLSGEGVCIRVGHHCAQPLMRHMKVNSTCRASFYIYNNKKDIDCLIAALEKTYELFKKWM